MGISRTLKIASVLAVGLAIIACGISFVWPSYTWSTRLSSPNGAYELIVLRQDASAFSDFYYVMYVFPHNSVPQDRIKNERVPYAWPWRGNKYRVYSGAAYPMFRWLDNNTVEINLNEAYFQEVSLWPIKIFSSSNGAVLTSLVFRKNGNAYAEP